VRRRWIVLLVAGSLWGQGCKSRDRKEDSWEEKASRQESQRRAESLSKHEEALEGCEVVLSFDTRLSKTTGLALDSLDRCYVTHEGGVALFNSNGDRLAGGWETESPARCVAVTERDEIVICFESSVSIGDAQNSLRAPWGRAGQGRGELGWITGVAVAQDVIFLADAGNRCVHRFTMNGDFVNDLGRKEDVEGEGIICPSPFLDVDVGEDGLVHVTNPGRLRVDVMRQDGELFFHWGKAGLTRDRFQGCCNPTNLLLLSDGYCAVAVKRPPGLRVFHGQGPGDFGRLVAWADASMFSDSDQGLDLAVDSMGRIWVLDVGAGTLHLMALKPRGKREVTP